MEIKNVLKLVNQAAGKNGNDISKALNISPAAYSQYLKSDFTSVIRFIEICKICDCDITISGKNGLNIKL